MTDALPTNPPASAPASLKALWPLVLEFALSDDDDREAILDGASSERLRKLVASVDSDAFAAINTYLDDTGNAEEAVPFGDLAQAAGEAGALLDARGDSA